MLNRRILRIKAFKVLYSSVLSGEMSLSHAETQLDQACEATRDLYIYMLGIVSPLTQIARDRIEAAKAKFNPTEEERNPNMKFAENALAKLLDEDVDFQKIFSKKKFSWAQYDLLLKKVMTSVAAKDYYKEYMASSEKLWIGGVGISVQQMQNVIGKLEQIFSDTLDEIIIDINGFIVSPNRSDNTPAGNILTFNTVQELYQYMSAHKNPTTDTDPESIRAFETYINTVMDYIGKI